MSRPSQEIKNVDQLQAIDQLAGIALGGNTVVEFDDHGDVKQHECAGTYLAIIQGIMIAANHLDHGLTSMKWGAEHDALYLFIGADRIAASSDSGLRLQQLGWTYDDTRDSWMMPS